MGPSQPAPPAVEVRDLIKRYRKAKVNAVDGISLRVEAGEFFALLGPNGAGKTTTISILTTTLAPTSGSIWICGRDLAREASAVRRQVRELASVLGMESDLFRPVKKLSGGMQRKLEIIRGLMHRPKVLFLDEPTRGLDVASRRSLWAYLREVREQYQVTMLLTTHYLEEAEQADRLCILNHGRIVAMGSPGEVMAHMADEYLELDAADRAQLRHELKVLNLQFDEDGMFKVRLDGRSAHEVIRSLDVPLTMLRTRQPSLEDAYLRILADE